MEQQSDGTLMLDLMIRPAFCVKNKIITRLNLPAAKLFLREGLSLDQLLESGAEEYAAFSGGMLCLTLNICGQSFGASVVRLGEEDVFTLDRQFECEELRVLALAARELRGPLANAMLSAQQLDGKDGKTSRLNRSLYQLLRIVGNMSDASGVSPVFHPELQNIGALFQEIAEKAAALSGTSGITFSYTGLTEEVNCIVDRQMMERAALNMISNALKFTPAGGSIALELRHSGKQFRFSVTDSGSGIPEKERATLFTRYLREPAIEDTRHGIGLGMLLIRSTAARHGGAVLVDCPKEAGTRVTMTFTAASDSSATLRTSLLQADYAGEQDHTLIELSEFLPPELY
ncbi:MAG: sensor histidine kinase [Faecousia sp.]